MSDLNNQLKCTLKKDFKTYFLLKLLEIFTSTSNYVYTSTIIIGITNMLINFNK